MVVLSSHGPTAMGEVDATERDDTSSNPAWDDDHNMFCVLLKPPPVAGFQAVLSDA